MKRAVLSHVVALRRVYNDTEWYDVSHFLDPCKIGHTLMHDKPLCVCVCVCVCVALPSTACNIAPQPS